MPTLPKMGTMPANGADALNAIRNTASDWYRANVPAADGTLPNLREIGKIITSYEPARNEFIDAINRIGRVIITSKLYENPYAMFKKGLLEMGETIEELFVEMAKPHDYNPEVGSEQQWRRELPDVRAAFHTMNYQKFYKQTVNNAQLRQAFLAYSGIIDLIGRIIDGMYTAANFDEFVTMKYMILRSALSGYLHPIAIPAVSKENASDIVTVIKSVSNDLVFEDTQYNYAGVKTYTNKDRQFLFINSLFDATMDVNVLATSFNMEKAEFMGHRILINRFVMTPGESERLALLFADEPWYVPFTAEEIAKLDTIGGVIVDRDWFQVYDNLYDMTQKYNGETMEWNYWYHVWKIFSSSPFHNAVLLASGAQTVTGVTVTPATATITKGSKLQLSAVVAGTGFVPQGVTWTVTGNVSASTKITASGMLSIGLDETSTTIDVGARSVADPGFGGTATITVSA